MSKLEWELLLFIQTYCLHGVKHPGFKVWSLIFHVVLWTCDWLGISAMFSLMLRESPWVTLDCKGEASSPGAQLLKHRLCRLRFDKRASSEGGEATRCSRKEQASFCLSILYMPIYAYMEGPDSTFLWYKGNLKIMTFLNSLFLFLKISRVM